ncbi:MAG: addiction module toxin, HicA family [Candidatus Aminicenantes bacterium RBG_13_63_10]|nr:MAG: addiction module toxin, HicA family [Candidatus Aminicenantes bacterium RBG_13_63_10]
MTKLRSLTAKEVIGKLRKAGFIFDRQAKGSHEIWLNPVTRRRTTVPNHPGTTIPKGTLKAILKAAGLTSEELSKL